MSAIGNDDSDSPAEVIDEHKDLFERLASSGLPIAEDAQRALEIVNEQRGKK